MRKFLIQLTIIMAVSFGVGIAYNQLSSSPLPIFERFVPPAAADEDASIYIQEMDAEVLRSLLESNMVLLLDARDEAAYDQNHIYSALSFPIGEFVRKYDGFRAELAGNRTIVTYCIDRDCPDSTFLAKKLYKKGHRDIYVYKGGIEEWISLGFPVEGK